MDQDMEGFNLETIAAARKAGDNQVMEKIFMDHQHYCINKLVNEKNCQQEEAEDIYVEAILNLRSRILTDRLSYLSNVRYYLGQTCVNMFYTRLKQKQRWDRHVPDVERFFYESDYIIREEDYHYEQAIAITRTIWSKMKEKCKDIIHYFYVDRLRMEEIAQLMSFSSADVAKTTKARCLKKMLQMAKDLQQPKP